jgi:hypothetical protein
MKADMHGLFVNITGLYEYKFRDYNAKSPISTLKSQPWSTRFV